jgi:CRP-like cAMP-binding protein
MHASLPSPDRVALEALIPRYSSERRLRQGKALYYQGDEAEAAYRVRSGRIRLLRVHGGDSQVSGEAGPGSWLCLAEVCLGLPCLADALALGACELERFSRYNFHELLREAVFKDLVIDELARGTYLLNAAIGSGGADERVARALVRACEEAPVGADRGLWGPGRREETETPRRGTMRLALTQAGLAASTGLARETVNRVLGRLEAAGFVETGRGEVLVYDLEGLRDWAG